MRRTKTFLITILLSFLLTGCIPLGDRFFRTDPRLPQPVNDIWVDAQYSGKELDVFRQKIYASYGKPRENSASVAQWSFDRGILTIDPVAGAFFVTRESEMIRIVRLRNPLKETLYGSYEMASRPTADYDHERCWLGDVNLRVNGTYLYKDSGNFLGQREDQSHNFFMLHPSGRYDVTYLTGFGPTTLVESIRGQRRIAVLVFQAPDGAKKTYFIASRTGFMVRELVFEGDQMEFEMEMQF
jgi:hypothetical protein